MTVVQLIQLMKIFTRLVNDLQISVILQLNHINNRQIRKTEIIAKAQLELKVKFKCICEQEFTIKWLKKHKDNCLVLLENELKMKEEEITEEDSKSS